MIEARGLTKFFGSIGAIKNVSFQIDKGEVVGFLGPNGAGKSTAIRILTCYMPPSAGTAAVEGFDIMENSLQIRQRVGYLPESVPLYHDLTVNRFLRFAAGSKGVEAKRMNAEISRVISACGLEKDANRIIRNLSKGFRQRVGLAQALLNDPSVLILDEPTIGLDPTQIIEIRRLIKELSQRRTILLSSHILPEVAQLCRRVIIINKGEIVATDSPENLTSQLQKTVKIVLEVTGPGREFAQAIENMAGVQKVSLETNGTSRLVIETDPATDMRPEIAAMAVQRGCGLLELRTMQLSLEDIFMQLVTEEPSGEGAES
ncbi:MAG TPA: ATP-binding cassette domain-containing protein [Syntrophobacteraceae bacterium]|nr:ATP-binding cassette domain-containing protein [Syntrophobacteraceae bacterium]